MVKVSFKRLKQKVATYADAKGLACNCWQGYHMASGNYGYVLAPFGQNEIYLGKTLKEATEQMNEFLSEVLPTTKAPPKWFAVEETLRMLQDVYVLGIFVLYEDYNMINLRGSFTYKDVRLVFDENITPEMYSKADPQFLAGMLYNSIRSAIRVHDEIPF